MKDRIIPNRLKPGDEVRVVALAQSLSVIKHDVIDRAKLNLEKLGLRVTFAENTFATNLVGSPNIDKKLNDLHTAFKDPIVKCVIAAVGGFDSNQLLSYIDWDLIANNPKIFCGYSDITVLNNAIFARTGLQTYSSPNFFCFGLSPESEYSLEYFKKATFTEKPYCLDPSKQFYDYPWLYNFSERIPQNNAGPKVFYGGKACGTIIGGNLCSFNLLNGTLFLPKVDDDIILMIEDDHYDSMPQTFSRNLQSIIQQPYFRQVKGILIGRFQNDTRFSEDIMQDILASKPELRNMPIIYNLDFGHTDPKFTYPIGGKMRVDADKLTLLVS